MKNVNKIAQLTQNTRSSDRNSWVILFYSFKDDAVYTEENGKGGRYFVTFLINPCTASDIKEAVKRWMNA